MRNSAVKKIIAVLLCLVVFTGSELTGLTNIVDDLFAEETTTGTDGGDQEKVVENLDVEAQPDDGNEDADEAPADVDENAAADETPSEDMDVDGSLQADPAEGDGNTEEAADQDVNDADPDTTEPEADGEETVTEEPGADENQDGHEAEAEVEDKEEAASDLSTGEDEDSADTENQADAGMSEDTKDQTDAGISEDAKDQTDAEISEDTKDQTDADDPTVQETEETDQKPEEEEEPQAFDEAYEDGQVIIHVEADPGVIPNGTELSVKKIVQQDVETLEDEDEIKEAEELNAKYEGIKSELELTVADDDTKEIAGFVAYDVHFLLTDEEGETEEIEPDGEVSVSMEFEEAYLPEEVAEKEDQIDIESIDVIHMEEAAEDEESETGLKSEVVADADVSTTENAVEKAAFTTDSGRTFVITWTENDLGEREYVCETEDATIKVTAAKGVVPDGALLNVVPILADNQATQKQYQDVEKKLLEKAESEQYQIAGFLAYDISFTDETGAKLEPEGEVKVAIDYKKAAIPKDLKDQAAYGLDGNEDSEEKDSDQAESAKTASENTAEESGKEEETSENSTGQTSVPAGNITVMHLEENDQGQVTKVVDMGAEGKVTELNSTKDQKVTSTEFVTESFSAFTIVWKDTGLTTEIQFYKFSETSDWINQPLDLDVADLGEIHLDEHELVITEEIKGGILSDYKQLKDKTTGGVYTFKLAKLKVEFSGMQQESYEIDTLRYVNGRIYFSGAFGEGDLDQGDAKFSVCFLYKEAASELPTVETVDNNDYGIKMRLINHTDADGNGTIKAGLKGNGANGFIANDTEAVVQGLVKDTLQSGYPVLNAGDRSLKELFSGGKEVNHLFIKDKLANEGYFEYNSSQNYAYLDGKDFKVYDVTGTPYPPGEMVDESYKRGNFLPFNDLNQDQRTSYKSQGKDLYLTDGVDYFFGLYMEASFAQPKGGKVASKSDPAEYEDMVYEFTGDDDLWIFIDDVLILDLGGIHNMCSGKIDFTTGRIDVEGRNDGTIRSKYEAAGIFPDGSPWQNNDDEIKKYFTDQGTFADYSGHTLKMFYMERGAGASNLQMKMNIPVIPAGLVQVQKQLGNTDKEKYKDVEFAFQIFAKEITGKDANGNEVYGENFVGLDTSEDQNVTFHNNVKFEGDNNTYDHVFYLKPGETAPFMIQENREYYVRELGVKSAEYDKVTVNKTEYTAEFDQNGNPVNSFLTAETTPMEAGKRPIVVYTNVCSGANSRELRITKRISNGQPVNEHDRFTFKVTLGGKEYEGSYYLTDSEGNYYTDVNGVLINQGKDAAVCKESTPHGVISNIPADFTVSITQIMSGTTFKVEEVDSETEEYTLVGITGEEDTYEQMDGEDSDSQAFSGKILLGHDAEVTVTNALKNAQTGGLSITKKLKEGSSDTEDSFVFRISWVEDGKLKPYEGSYSVGADVKSASNGEITIKADETARIEMPAETQFKVEEVLSEGSGYGTPDIKVAEETAANWKVEGNVAEGTVLKGQYADITVTNVPAYSYDWQIVKRGTAEGSKPLGGAEFTLTSKAAAGEAPKVYYGKSQESTGEILWFQSNSYEEKDAIHVSDIAPGEYELEETKAPTGYIQSSDKWKMILTYGQIMVEDASGKIEVTPTTENGRPNYAYTFLNEAVYELPSTGGAGIFGYMISGVLLMMAGVLILYKRKYAGRC